MVYFVNLTGIFIQLKSQGNSTQFLLCCLRHRYGCHTYAMPWTTQRTSLTHARENPRMNQKIRLLRYVYLFNFICLIRLYSIETLYVFIRGVDTNPNRKSSSIFRERGRLRKHEWKEKQLYVIKLSFKARCACRSRMVVPGPATPSKFQIRI